MMDFVTKSIIGARTPGHGRGRPDPEKGTFVRTETVDLSGLYLASPKFPQSCPDLHISGLFFALPKGPDLLDLA